MRYSNGESYRWMKKIRGGVWKQKKTENTITKKMDFQQFFGSIRIMRAQDKDIRGGIREA